MAGLDLHVRASSVSACLQCGGCLKTALVGFRFVGWSAGTLRRTAGFGQRPRGCIALSRCSALPGIGRVPFVVGGESSGADDLRWLGEWIVAVTVAIQRWGRDPVFRGRVCGVEDGRLRLAIPWCREGFSTRLVCGAAGGWRLVEVRAAGGVAKPGAVAGLVEGDGAEDDSPVRVEVQVPQKPADRLWMRCCTVGWRRFSPGVWG